MRCLKEHFSGLCAAEQNRLKSEARAERAKARRAPSRLEDSLRKEDDDAAQGPWGLAAPTGSPFPLRTSALSEALVGTNVDSLSDGWAKLHTVAAEPSADFPDTVDLPEVCVGGCCRDFCPPEDPDPTDEGLRRWAPETRRLWRHLLLACRFGPTTQKDPFVVLRFNSAGVADFVLVAHQSHNDNSLFEGTFFRMAPVGNPLASGSGLLLPPFFLQIQAQAQDTAVGAWPCVESEAGLLRRLLALASASSWGISHVASRAVGADLMARHVTEIKPFEYERALALEEEAAAQAAALRALRKIMRPPGSSRPSHSARARGRGRARSTASGPGKARKAVGQKGSFAPETSDESEESEDAELKSYWADITKSFTKKLGTASGSGKASGVAASSSAAPPAPAPPAPAPPAPPVGAASARRQPKRRDYAPAIGGGFCFYEAYVGGSSSNSYDNWIMTCPRHEHCQKTRGVGAFSTRRHGELEPLAFLHAWRDMDVPPGRTHRRCTPTQVAIDHQMGEHMMAFAELNAEFRA